MKILFQPVLWFFVFGQLLAFGTACRPAENRGVDSHEATLNGASNVPTQNLWLSPVVSEPPTTPNLAGSDLASVSKDEQGRWTWARFDTGTQPGLSQADIEAHARAWLSAEAGNFGVAFEDLVAPSGGSVALTPTLRAVVFGRKWQNLLIPAATMKLYYSMDVSGVWHLGEVYSRLLSQLSVVNSRSGTVPIASVMELLKSQGMNDAVPTSAIEIVIPYLSSQSDEEATLRRATEITYKRPGWPGDFSITVENGGRQTLDMQHLVYTAAAIQAKVFERSYLDARIIDSPLAFADASFSGLVAKLGGDGDYSAVNPEQVAVTLISPMTKIVDDSTGQPFIYPVVVNGTGAVIQEVDKSRARALNAYAAVQRIRKFALSFTKLSEVPVANIGPLVRIDNGELACNAAFFPSTFEMIFFNQGFGTQGDNCANTADINDVIYHEWGHSLDNSVGTRLGIPDGPFSEGIGDIVSAYYTGSSDLGAGLFLDSATPLRQLQNTRTYPPLSDSERRVHSQGLIIGGAFWDLRKALIQRYGQTKGSYQAGWLFFRHLLTTDFYLDSYQTVSLLDDDDSNPATPSPNSCLINKAFASHGLAVLTPSCADPVPTAIPVAGDLTFSLQDQAEQQARLQVTTSDGSTIKICLQDRNKCGQVDAYTVPLALVQSVGGVSTWASSGHISVYELLPVTIGKFSASGELLSARMFRISSK